MEQSLEALLARHEGRQAEIHFNGIAMLGVLAAWMRDRLADEAGSGVQVGGKLEMKDAVLQQDGDICGLIDGEQSGVASTELV